VKVRLQVGNQRSGVQLSKRKELEYNKAVGNPVEACHDVLLRELFAVPKLPLSKRP